MRVTTEKLQTMMADIAKQTGIAYRLQGYKPNKIRLFRVHWEIGTYRYETDFMSGKETYSYLCGIFHSLAYHKKLDTENEMG